MCVSACLHTTKTSESILRMQRSSTIPGEIVTAYVSVDIPDVAEFRFSSSARTKDVILSATNNFRFRQQLTANGQERALARWPTARLRATFPRIHSPEGIVRLPPNFTLKKRQDT